MTPETPEAFVDVAVAAKFLTLRPRRVLEMARARVIPAHALGIGKRKTWRFRLSEIAAAVTKNVFTSREDAAIRDSTPSNSRRGYQETSSR